jgi:hypothetical protein
MLLPALIRPGPPSSLTHLHRPAYHLPRRFIRDVELALLYVVVSEPRCVRASII